MSKPFAINQEIIASGTAVTSDPTGAIPKPPGERASFFIQLIWTSGGAADASLEIQERSNETDDWTTKTIIDSDGTFATSQTLDISAAGSHTIEFDSASAPYMQIKINKGASAGGTIGARITGYSI